MKRRICVRGVIEKDGKIFCVRQKHHDGSINNFWCIPGGGLEANESLQDGLDRELIEELGVKPEIGELLTVQQYSDDGGEFIEFFFKILNYDDYSSIDLLKTSHGELELVEYGFVDPKNTYILPDFIKDYPKIKKLYSYL
jgi:ADP-ribose pyrophosphatase YjhB (NUDIX family)